MNVDPDDRPLPEPMHPIRLVRHWLYADGFTTAVRRHPSRWGPDEGGGDPPADLQNEVFVLHKRIEELVSAATAECGELYPYDSDDPSDAFLEELDARVAVMHTELGLDGEPHRIAGSRHLLDWRSAR